MKTTAVLMVLAYAAINYANASDSLPAGWVKLSAENQSRILSRYGTEVGVDDAYREASRGSTPVIYVGDDPACDFTASAALNGLQAAINSAESDANGAALTEVRVANSGNYLGRQLFINGLLDQSIRVVGGYATCSSATPDVAGITTVINADGSGRPLTIGDTSGQELVELENLRFTGGNADIGGGMSMERGNLVIVRNASFNGNNASVQGGGISVSSAGGQATLWLFDTFVSLNTSAGRGGGVYCGGNGGEVSIDTSTQIGLNDADAGGGLAVAFNCAVTSYAGFPDGIFANAARRGGGAHVADGGRFTLNGGESNLFGFGDATRVASIDGNLADDGGGGIFLIGPDSRAISRDAQLFGNLADADKDGFGNGGAVLVFDGSFTMHRSLSGNQCHTVDRCSALTGNSAVSGGAVAARRDNVRVDIRQTYIENNAIDQSGAAVFISNAGGSLASPASLTMDGVVIANNRAGLSATFSNQTVIDVQSNSTAVLSHLTMTDNLDNSGTGIIGFDNVSIDIFSSILWEHRGSLFRSVWDADTQGSVDCLIVRNTATLPPNQFGTISVTNPLLLGPTTVPGQAYHLTASSPAIDACDAYPGADAFGDVVGNARGVDDPPTINTGGPYDLGAAELNNDILFINSFD